MANVEFEDNTIEVIGEIDSKINIALEECAGVLESRAKRNTRVKSSDTKNSWQHYVDEERHIAYVGNPKQNAIWEEFGTGEYAVKGRKGGYWVFVDDGSDAESAERKSSKTYTLKEAKRVVAILRSKGLEAYYTKGKAPSRALQKAVTSTKAKIVKRLQSMFSGG